MERRWKGLSGRASSVFDSEARETWEKPSGNLLETLEKFATIASSA